MNKKYSKYKYKSESTQTPLRYQVLVIRVDSQISYDTTNIY